MAVAEPIEPLGTLAVAATHSPATAAGPMALAEPIEATMATCLSCTGPWRRAAAPFPSPARQRPAARDVGRGGYSYAGRRGRADRGHSGHLSFLHRKVA
ncbi:MAG: hypothetical protein M1826_000786 [Phylliscum demangeonii]|nr:MAG: hypothetical protein M1826_000786 [Phylliscum demangeonii]